VSQLASTPIFARDFFWHGLPWKLAAAHGSRVLLGLMSFFFELVVDLAHGAPLQLAGSG
jgi:hypothetical protein